MTILRHSQRENLTANFETRVFPKTSSLEITWTLIKCLFGLELIASMDTKFLVMSKNAGVRTTNKQVLLACRRGTTRWVGCVRPRQRIQYCAHSNLVACGDARKRATCGCQPVQTPKVYGTSSGASKGVRTRSGGAIAHASTKSSLDSNDRPDTNVGQSKAANAARRLPRQTVKGLIRRLALSIAPTGSTRNLKNALITLRRRVESERRPISHDASSSIRRPDLNVMKAARIKHIVARSGSCCHTHEVQDVPPCDSSSVNGIRHPFIS